MREAAWTSEAQGRLLRVLVRHKRLRRVMCVSWLFQADDGAILARCGACGRGRLRPTKGFKCRVCGVRVAVVEREPVERWRWRLAPPATTGGAG